MEIINVFAVDFDRSLNPLHDHPSESAKTVRVPREVFIHPVEIKGNWLKVRLEDVDSSKFKVKGYGGVKWKENNKLIIELFSLD